jgi:hypothetical protein
LFIVSHTGAPAMVHWELPVQPGRQFPPRLHMGVVPLQSAFEEHWAHM